MLRSKTSQETLRAVKGRMKGPRLLRISACLPLVRLPLPQRASKWARWEWTAGALAATTKV